MTRIPKFKNQIRVQVVPPDLVFFMQESSYRVVQGRLLFLIAPWIDGKRTIPQIAHQLKDHVTSTEVEYGLLLLEAEGYLDRRLKTAAVRVVSFGRVPASRFASILTNHGLRVSTRAGFTVVLVDDYLQVELEDFNRKAIRNKTTWMLVKPVGNILWFGPVFSPPQNACWRCLAERLKEKRRVEAFLKAHGVQHDYEPSLHQAADLVLHLAAAEILKWTSTVRNSKEPSALMTLDLNQMKLEKHAVMRRDDCPECGEPAEEFPAPVTWNRSKKILNYGSPADVIFRKHEYHISLRTGIVDQLTTYGNGVIHSVAADHLFVPTVKKDELLKKGLTQKSWGKGVTVQEAKTGALCEALERYSGVYRGNEFRIEKSYKEIEDQAIAVNACMNFSEAQYENREKWNRSHTDHDWVPMRLDPRRKIEWTPVWSLTNNAFKYLPTAYCYYGYPFPPDHYFCRADSNGNAAGNTLEEAILNGFMELVERDCAALWWHNRVRRPAVDLESFGLPYIDEVRNQYRTAGRRLWVLDITSDFEIPCFVALSAPTRSDRVDFLIGLGAHFDPVVALRRSITEMNQFLAVRMSGHARRKNGQIIRNETFLTPDASGAPKKVENFSSRFRGNVTACVKLAKERGMEMLVLNQTRADVGMPVVKVIVPGMRQIWARFGKGRLYDVPVKMGWLKMPLTEDQLNPDRFLI